MKKKFDIRWVLDYMDKRVRTGPWTTPGFTKESRASMQPRIGLAGARIQSRKILYDDKTGVMLGYGVVETVVECNKESFLEFRWHKLKPVNLTANLDPNQYGEITYGLMIVTPSEKISYFIDGSLRFEANNEKTFHPLAWT